MSPLKAPIENPQGGHIYFEGPDLSLGPLPAVIFFALSAKTSLYVDPFNQSVLDLAQHGIRVFSWDLPFHHDGADPKEAMNQCIQEFTHNPQFINNFTAQCRLHLDYLIEQHIVTSLAVAGLSRGAFFATQWAAQEPRLTTILGFAPLTHQMATPSIIHPLIYKRLRFYIGNHDQRVGTDQCFAFIKKLTDTAIQEGIRSPQVEMIIYPSIGYQGHGTPPNIFHEGANWLKPILKDT
jgi:esterase FrsA